MPQILSMSFLPTQGRQQHQKLDYYAQLYVKYTTLFQQQGDAMRHDMQKMEAAYHQVAAEFTAEQNAYAKNKLGAEYVLADLNEYARRCDICPQTYKE
jgi:hypothetical protein